MGTSTSSIKHTHRGSPVLSLVVVVFFLSDPGTCPLNHHISKGDAQFKRTSTATYPTNSKYGLCYKII